MQAALNLVRPTIARASSGGAEQSAQQQEQNTVEDAQRKRAFQTLVHSVSQKLNTKNTPSDWIWQPGLIEQFDEPNLRDGDNNLDYKLATHALRGVINVYQRRVLNVQEGNNRLMRQVDDSNQVDLTDDGKQGPSKKSRAKEPRPTVLAENQLFKITLGEDFQDSNDPIIGQYQNKFHSAGFKSFLTYSMTPDSIGRLSFEETHDKTDTLVHMQKRLDIDRFSFKGIDKRSVCPRLSLLTASIDRPLGDETASVPDAKLLQSHADAASQIYDQEFAGQEPLDEDHIYEFDYGERGDMREGDLDFQIDANYSTHYDQSRNQSMRNLGQMDSDQPDYGEDYEPGAAAPGPGPGPGPGNSSRDLVLPRTKLLLDQFMDNMYKTIDPPNTLKRAHTSNSERGSEQTKKRRTRDKDSEPSAVDFNVGVEDLFAPAASEGALLRNVDRLPSNTFQVQVLDSKFFMLNMLDVQPQSMSQALAQRFESKPTASSADYDLYDQTDFIIDDAEQGLAEMQTALHDQQEYDDGLLQAQQNPVEVRGIFIRRKVDQRKLKARIFESIEKGGHTLSEVREATCQMYDEIDQPSLNRKSFFLSLLYVANEHGLRLESLDQFHDLRVVTRQ